MKYVIKQYDENGRLVERFDDYTSISEAQEEVEWFMHCDKMEQIENTYTIEVEEQ